MAEPYVKADVRRAQLIAAAREVLERDGMAGATLRAVAAQAGVPLGTVHYIFATKEQLLRAVLEDVIDEMRGNIDVQIARGDAFSVGFISEDPRTAMRVAERLALAYAAALGVSTSLPAVDSVTVG